MHKCLSVSLHRILYSAKYTCNYLAFIVYFVVNLYIYLLIVYILYLDYFVYLDFLVYSCILFQVFGPMQNCLSVQE